MPTRQAPPTTNQSTPCGDPTRSPLDVAGRLNDLINCYILTASKYAKTFVVYGVMGVILVAIIILAAYTFIKD